ncbi:unnamed protein product, partial [marine sediment metagenome]
TEKVTSTKQPFAGSKETIELTDKTGIKDITATVSIPRDYYEEMAKSEVPDGQDPDAALVLSVIDREVLKLKEKVMRAIGLGKPEDAGKVVVDTYWAAGGGVADSASALAATDVAAAGAGGSVTGTIRRYGKHIAVSALALLSLFMALMMVRKATGPVEMKEEEATAMMMQGKKPLDALSLEESNLADGAEGGGLLAGIELDEDAVRSQQMLEQIRDMVKESPETSSNLISKWIAQGD